MLAPLSTAGIQDPQTRAFLDRLMQTWGQSFVLREDVQREATQAMVNALGAGGTQAPVPGGATQLIDSLSAAIRDSLVQRMLETKITLPDLQGLRNEVNAGFNSVNTTRTAADRALASAVNRVWSYIGGSTALIEQGALADVTPSGAVADKWNTVVAAVTDPNTGEVASAAILEETRAYANANDGTLNAIYSVKAQVGHGGSTLVGGFMLAATDGAGSSQGPTIDFGVMANKFWIGAPASGYDPAAEYTSNNQFPFIVVTTPTTINGVTYAPGVYMKKVVVGDASIDNAKIGRYIASDTFDGTIDGSGAITADGTTGWAIDKTGRAVFSSVRLRKLVDSSSGYNIYSNAATSWQGDVTDTGVETAPGSGIWLPYPYTNSSLRMFGPDYHNVAPINQRVRYAPDAAYPVVFCVTVSATADDGLALWYRITSGSWVRLAALREPQPGDGSAAITSVLISNLLAGQYIDFGVTGTRPDDTFFDVTKRYLKYVTVTVTCVNL